MSDLLAERLEYLGERGLGLFPVLIRDPNGVLIGTYLTPHRNPGEAIAAAATSSWSLSRIARWEGVIPMDSGPDASKSPILASYSIPPGYQFVLRAVDPRDVDPMTIYNDPFYFSAAFSNKQLEFALGDDDEPLESEAQE